MSEQERTAFDEQIQRVEKLANLLKLVLGAFWSALAIACALGVGYIKQVDRIDTLERTVAEDRVTWQKGQARIENKLDGYSEKVSIISAAFEMYMRQHGDYPSLQSPMKTHAP